MCCATRHRFQFEAVKERLAWNWQRSQEPNFVSRMVTEIRKKGVMVLRVHSAGDFATPAYAEKWLSVMKQCPRTRFYGYSRSYCIPEIAAVLEKMAALRCCKLWYSVDRDTGLPDWIPPGVRLAHLQVERDEIVNADLVFRVRRLRKDKPIGLPMVCPSEQPKKRVITCGGCRRCFE